LGRLEESEAKEDLTQTTKEGGVKGTMGSVKKLVTSATARGGHSPQNKAVMDCKKNAT